MVHTIQRAGKASEFAAPLCIRGSPAHPRWDSCPGRNARDSGQIPWNFRKRQSRSRTQSLLCSGLRSLPT